MRSRAGSLDQLHRQCVECEGGVRVGLEWEGSGWHGWHQQWSTTWCGRVSRLAGLGVGGLSAGCDQGKGLMCADLKRQGVWRSVCVLAYILVQAHLGSIPKALCNSGLMYDQHQQCGLLLQCAAHFQGKPDPTTSPASRFLGHLACHRHSQQVATTRNWGDDGSEQHRIRQGMGLWNLKPEQTTA